MPSQHVPVSPSDCPDPSVADPSDTPTDGASYRTSDTLPARRGRGWGWKDPRHPMHRESAPYQPGNLAAMIHGGRSDAVLDAVAAHLPRGRPGVPG
jgi:hypothetical protein